MEHETERLRALRRYDVLDTRPEEHFARITRLAAAHFDVSMAAVSLVDAERLWFKSGQGVALEETPREGSFCHYAIQTDEVTVVEDAHQDPRFADQPLVTEAPHVRFYAGAPLTTPDGYRLGTFCLLDPEPRALTAPQCERLADLAAMTMDELELRRQAAANAEAEEAQRAQKEFTDTLLKGLPGIVYLFDEHGRVKQWNDRLEEVSGYAPDEICAMQPLDFVAEEDRAAVEASIRTCFDEGTARVEAHFLSRDGTHTPFLFHGQRLLLDGEPHLVGMGVDISERRVAMQRLHHRIRLEKIIARISTQLLSPDADLNAVLALLGEAAEVSRVYIFSMRDGGRLMENTHEWTAPGTPSQIETKGLLPPDALPWWFERLQQSETLRIRTPDLPPAAGALRAHLEADGIQSLLDVPIRLSDGTLHGFIGFDDTDAERCWEEDDVRLLCMVSDLLAHYYERRQAEAARREAQQETTQLLESISDAFIALDGDWRFTYVNDEAEQLLERSREHLLGKSVWDDSEANASVAYEQYHRAVQEQTDVHFERWHPALERWLEVHAYPYRDGLSVFFSDITERKLTERALQQSEKRHRTLVERAGGIITVADEDGTVRYESPAVLRILGRAPTRTKGAALTKHVHPDDRRRVRSTLATLRAHPDEVVTMTCRIRHENGSWVHLEIVARNLLDDPAIEGFVLNSRDITERKRAELAVRASEKRFRRLVERSSDIITIMEADGTVRYHSPASEAITGRTQEEVQSLDPFSLIHPDDRATARAAFERLREEPEEVITIQVRMRPKNQDGWIHLEMVVRNLLNDPAVRGFVINSRDITDRKQAERALRASEKRFRALIERASDIMTIMEADGTVRYQSPSFRKVLGHTPDSLVGRPIFEGIHPGDREHVRAHFEQSLQQPGESITVQYRTRHADGRWMHLESVVRNMLDEPHIEGIVANTRDISERVQVEAEREARQRAEELLRTKSTFLNNMSHELRTPLASILGFADILAEEGEGLHHEFAQRIATSGKRLQETLNSVLNLAQIEGGTIELNLQAVEMTEKAAEAVALLQPLAQQKDLTLEATRPEQDAPPAQALLDPQALHRILNNLVGNALKFTEEGRVTVATSCDREEVHLQVRDTGIGISDAFMPHLFDDFKQESSGLQRTHEGSGLGLTITKRLVEMMDGRIEVVSTPGEGSCFTVSFPRLVPEVDAPVPEEPEVPASEDPPCDPSASSLLVVEDNENTRVLADRILSAHYDVITAPDPHTARARAQECTFDLLLIDINLCAEIDGVALLGVLRTLPAHEHVPAIAVTAHAMPGDEEQFLDAGFDAYLSKPFTKNDLLSVVERTLASAEAP